MTLVRLTKDELSKLNLSEKLVLYYRYNPVEAAKDLLGVDLVWFQRATLEDMWFKKYNLLLMSRGIGKSWLLALFAILYAMLFPGAQIGVITPSFKQTEFLFDKITDFYEDSPYLRASTDKFQKTTYKAFLRLHNRAFVEGLPLGTGEKIRGRRYNVILIDEYAFVDEDIIKKVVRPMMNVKKKGVDNKYIIASTAYYTWNHFYLQYLLYNLMSVKKPELYGLNEYIFEDLKMVNNPPFELDEEVYKMMEMDTTKEDYEMENLCLTDCNTIICENGVKNIKDVLTGDKVLSGSGKFEKVLKKSKRLYSGEIIKIKSYKNKEVLEVTPEHPIYVKRNNKYEYVEAKNLSVDDKLAFCIPLSENNSCDLEKAYLQGLYVAEGIFFTDNRPKKRIKNRYTGYLHFSLHQKENIYTQRIIKYFTSLGKKPVIYDSKEGFSREIRISDTSINHEIFKDFIKFGRKSYLKVIPSEVFNWSYKAKIEFIKGILDGDGYFNKKFISIDLVSEDVIKKLKFLLSQLEIQSAICYYPSKNNNQHDIWRLNITSKFAEKIYSWYREQPYNRECYRTYGDIENNDNNDKYSWYKIKSIEVKDFIGYVYNLEIEHNPSYITSICQVHNCRFPVENVGFISARLIDQCTPKRTEDKDTSPIEVTGDKSSIYTMGIDAARVAGGDNFAISIMKLENGIKKLVHVFILNGSPYQEMIYHIRRLMEEFNIVQINCDAGGGGTTIRDLLSQPYKTIDGRILPAIYDMDDKDFAGRDGLYILRMVNFTRISVNDLYMRLKADMQHKNINFPIDVRRHSDIEYERVAKQIIEAKRELLILQAEGKGNYYQFDVPSGFKKDRATALALANQAANQFIEVYKEQSYELADGFWLLG